MYGVVRKQIERLKEKFGSETVATIFATLFFVVVFFLAFEATKTHKGFAQTLHIIFANNLPLVSRVSMRHSDDDRIPVPFVVRYHGSLPLKWY